MNNEDDGFKRLSYDRCSIQLMNGLVFYSFTLLLFYSFILLLCYRATMLLCYYATGFSLPLL